MRATAKRQANSQRKRLPGNAGTPCPVVALGASAGGLEVLTNFIEAMPPDSGMAFVLIQHLDPEHESLMAELLGVHTTMNVGIAEEGMSVEPNQVYVIPPKALLTIREGKLHLEPKAERSLQRMPIDMFFRSLAEDQREKAICIVLSGTGTDGTLGLKAIKERGGLVVVQEPTEAPHPGMPRSAIATGFADLILPVADMPDALIPYVRHHYVKAGGAPAVFGDKARSALVDIIDFLKEHSAIDFDLYKEGTLLRRIERRMGLNHIESGARYHEFLRENPQEVEGLCRDLLISVTSFFRDPEVFKQLEHQIIPEIIGHHSTDQPIRAWVAGCATGEEAYSLAMLLAETVATPGRHQRVQIFASDVDEQALAIARSGIYPESIEAEVSKARLARFFVKENHTYRVLPELREMIIFANHNLLSDAPFSHLDLILCRNVLIYINPNVQKQVVGIFHFALRRDGVLVLGLSETVGDQTDLFQPLSRKLRFYRREGRGRHAHFDLPVTGARRPAAPTAAHVPPPPAALALAELTRRILIEHFTPAAVLINAKNEGLFFSGPVDTYIRVPTGEASRDIIAMLRNGLRAKVRRGLAQTSATHEPTVVHGAFVIREGKRRPVTVTVQPVEHDQANLRLITFEEELKYPPDEAVPAARSESAEVKNYENELEATRRELQTTIRDLERANEELKAANEEAMSMNEEFQSTNEELETSKEELQSLNEELTTLNSQLQEKVEEQRRTANDLENLLTSSDIATIFLDRSMHIKRYTRSATELFNLVSTDIGRAFTDIKWKVDDPRLINDAKEVLKTLIPSHCDVQSADGKWFTRRILPYRTQEDSIEGVVVTLVDISEQKATQEKEQTSRAFYESIVDTVRDPLVVLDQNLKIVMTNRAYNTAFVTSHTDSIGRSIFEIEDRSWDVPKIRALLERVIPTNATVDDYEVDCDIKGIGWRKLRLSTRRVRVDGRPPDYILLAIVDVTESEKSREELEDRTARLASILSTTPDAVINIDGHGAIASFSPGAEQIFGYAPEEVIGMGIDELLVSGPGRRIVDDYLAAYGKPERHEFKGAVREVMGRRKDGSTVPLMLNVTETQIGDLNVLTGVLRDMTEQKHTEDELRQARKMEVMGQLVGGVAHDFNNLLTVILGNLELLARRQHSKGEGKRIAAAHDAARLAANLTSQMLVFARRRALTPTAIDVNRLVSESVEMMRRMIDERFEISTVLGKNVDGVFADEATLRAALLNLVINSRDAMPDGGKLTLKTAMTKAAAKPGIRPSKEAEQPFVSISITDTGVGMTPEVLARALEPFFTTKEIGVGTGLGLAMVHGFVKQSGGNIEMASSPGKGTTVTILLPALDAPVGETGNSAPASASRPDLPRGNRERILLVEDDARVREATALRLKTLGYDVVEADSGPAALELMAGGEKFDLLFTDAIMPKGMNGIDLARKMRKQRPDLPVLVTSGYTPAELGIEPGDILLEKPYTIDMLARRLREVLDK